MKRTLIAIALVLLTVPPTSADTIDLPVGDPVVTGSWAQWFVSPRSSLFDTQEYFLLSGGPFENPALAFQRVDGTPAPTWSSQLVNPRYALATGSPVDLQPYTTDPFALMEQLRFASDISEPLTYHFLVWSGGVFGTLVSVSQGVWSGAGWSISIFEPPPPGFDPRAYDRTPVPEPASLLLLGTGLIGAVRAVRRRRW